MVERRYMSPEPVTLPAWRLPAVAACCLILALAALALGAAEPPAPRLSARGTFDAPSARAGDTVEYRLRVEWREVPAAVMVLPPRDELKTSGFHVIGQSTQHRKTASAGGLLNVTEFSYLLVAGEAGTGRVSPFLLRYRNGASGAVETVPVPGAALEIGSARVPWWKRLPVRLGAGLAALLAAFALVRAARNRRRDADEEDEEKEDEFSRAITGLKNRCDAADSRAWLNDAERLSVEYLCRGLGVSRTRDVRFEAALAQYLDRRAAISPGEAESWVKLRDLFHEARYAGGRREPHELREACRHLKTCLTTSGNQGERIS
jgi:hypothetical protein